MRSPTEVIDKFVGTLKKDPDNHSPSSCNGFAGLPVPLILGLKLTILVTLSANTLVVINWLNVAVVALCVFFGTVCFDTTINSVPVNSAVCSSIWENRSVLSVGISIPHRVGWLPPYRCVVIRRIGIPPNVESGFHY